MEANATRADIWANEHKAARFKASFRQRLTRNLVSLKKASTIEQSQNYAALSEKR